ALVSEPDAREPGDAGESQPEQPGNGAGAAARTAAREPGDPGGADPADPAVLAEPLPGFEPAVAETPVTSATATAPRPTPPEAEEGPPEGETPADPATRLLRRRDADLAGPERELGRKLKRVLADEQNEVLD